MKISLHLKKIYYSTALVTFLGVCARVTSVMTSKRIESVIFERTTGQRSDLGPIIVAYTIAHFINFQNS